MVFSLPFMCICKQTVLFATAGEPTGICKKSGELRTNGHLGTLSRNGTRWVTTQTKFGRGTEKEVVELFKVFGWSPKQASSQLLHDEEKHAKLFEFVNRLDAQTEYNVYQVLEIQGEKAVRSESQKGVRSFSKLLFGHHYLVAVSDQLPHSFFESVPRPVDARGMRTRECVYMLDFDAVDAQNLEQFKQKQRETSEQPSKPVAGQNKSLDSVFFSNSSIDKQWLQTFWHFRRLIPYGAPERFVQTSPPEFIDKFDQLTEDQKYENLHCFKSCFKSGFVPLKSSILHQLCSKMIQMKPYSQRAEAPIQDPVQSRTGSCSPNFLSRHMGGAQTTPLIDTIAQPIRQNEGEEGVQNRDLQDMDFGREFRPEIDPARPVKDNIQSIVNQLKSQQDEQRKEDAAAVSSKLKGLAQKFSPNNQVPDPVGGDSVDEHVQTLSLVIDGRIQQVQREADVKVEERDQKTRHLSEQHENKILSVLEAIKQSAEKTNKKAVFPVPTANMDPVKYVEIIDRILHPPTYTVVFLGESGTGKSTTICSIGNYLKYRTFEEARRNKMDICIPLRFTATPEGGPVATVECFPDSVDNSANENFNEAGQSVTQEARVHTFDYKEARFRIIDTPGLSDTRGMQQDTVNLDKIRAVVNQQEQIHAICLVLKSNESRLRPEFELATRQLLSLFPKKALDNVFLFFTFASGTFFAIGDSVEMLSTLQQKLTQSHGRCFQIQQNTCCIDAESFKYRLCQERSIRYSSRSESSFHHCWDHSAAKITNFLAFLQKMQPISGEEIKKMEQHVQLGEALARDFVEGDNAELQRLKGDVETVLFHVKNEAMPFNVNLLSVDRDSPLQKDVSEAAFNASLARLSRFSKSSK